MYIFKAIALLCASFLFLGLQAQVSNIEGILEEIEKNNSELKSIAHYYESKKLLLKSGNNLPDPQIGGYFLPFGEYTGDAYTEFQISQSFDFPTVYSARNKMIKQNGLSLDIEYRKKRQDILLQAHQHCIALIIINKRVEIEKKRATDSKKVYQHNEALFEKKQVGTLDLNKAKIAWLQGRFKLEQLEKERSNSILVLKTLNGGKPIDFSVTDFNDVPIALEKDSLWKAKLSSDPRHEQFQQQRLIAEQQLKLSKSYALPKITAGYNYQGNAAENYSGLYAGISIPLWSNRNKVNAAKSNLEFRETSINFKTEIAYSEFEKQFQKYEVLLSEFTEYKKTLNALNSEELLFKAYDLGEISFLEYYLELQFYRTAVDSFLDIEKRLFQVQAQLLKHQL